MNNGAKHLSSSGRLLHFLNPPGLYPVNAYQSLVLAAACEMAVLARAVREARPLAEFSAWEPCCGGGPVAVALKSLGVGYVQATDVNPLAVASCIANAAHNGLPLDRAVMADILDDDADRRFDFICANPPCGAGPVVARTNRPLREAVDGGDDGMEPTLDLLRKAPARLNPGGSLILIVVSTGHIVRLARALEAQCPGNWRVLPCSPVAAPWCRADDPRMARFRDECRDFQPLVWSRADGWVWRLSWVVEVFARPGEKERGSGDMVSGFPLLPYGHNVALDEGLQALIRRQSKNGFWLATE